VARISDLFPDAADFWSADHPDARQPFESPRQWLIRVEYGGDVAAYEAAIEAEIDRIYAGPAPAIGYSSNAPTIAEQCDVFGAWWE
jgi:hypothetical protein